MINVPLPAENGRKAPGVCGYLLPDFETFSGDSKGLRKRQNGHLLPDGNLARRALIDAGFYWDRELPGFGLRVYASGRRRWIVQLRQRGSTRRITLGEPESMSAPEARGAARSLLAQNALDGLPTRKPPMERADPRFTSYVEEFWRDYSGHWKESTQQRNRHAIEKRLIPYFGSRYIGSITRADILAWRDSLHERQGIFNRTIPVLAAMLGYAEKLGYRPKGSNPCRGIPRYKRKLPERYMTPKEYKRLAGVLRLAEPRWPDAVAAIRVLIYTGARSSEIAGLQAAWIDPPYAHLPDSKTGPKRLYLNAQALAIIEARREIAGDGPLFPDVDAQAHHLGYVWGLLKRQAALPDVRLHDLRHSFASVAIMDGLSLARVGRILGHSLPETTARYAHLSDEAVGDAAARVSGSIAAALGIRP